MFMVTVRKNQQIVDLGATKTGIKQVHLKLIITPVTYVSTGTSPTIMGWRVRLLVQEPTSMCVTYQ